jgi:hypothetical protein
MLASFRSSIRHWLLASVHSTAAQAVDDVGRAMRPEVLAFDPNDVIEYWRDDDVPPSAADIREIISWLEKLAVALEEEERKRLSHH